VQKQGTSTVYLGADAPSSGNADDTAAELRVLIPKLNSVVAEIGKVIVGQDDIIHSLMLALVSRGHVLMIGLPGLVKILMVRTLSEVLDLRFRRIQFTPDLMPTDITGTDVLEVDEATGHRPRLKLHC
jgi:MoxR-like ATPase